MNILEQTEALKDLPDQALVQEMQMPTGMAAPVFITAELKRRQRMRNEYKRREAQDMPSVAEEVVMAAGMPQGGIADAARAMAPKSSIAQNTGMNEMMPRTATQAPQRMAEGGIVRMARGGKTQVVYNGLGYFVFADGDVQDALGKPVSDELAQAVKGSISVGPEIPEFDPNDMMPSFDVGESRTLASPQRPEGDDSPSIADVSPSLEDARGREFGPLQPEQFSSMNMVPSFDVGELKTLADPEVIPASEQLPTRPRSIDPTYSETAYPMFSESTYEQGLESTPDTGEMQRPALPVLGSDTRLSMGEVMRGTGLPAAVDLDLVGGQTQAPSEPYVPFIPIEPRIGERSIGVGDTFSRAAAAREQGLDMPETVLPVDVRGDPSQYGFPQADNIAMGKSIQKMDDVITQQIKDIDLDIPTDMATDPDFASRSLQEASFNMPESLPARLTPTSFSPDPEALPLDDSVVDMAATELPPTLGGGDPAIERGIASALAQNVSARNVVTAPTIDGGDKKPTTPITPSVTGTGSSPLRDRISRMLDEREANKDADKWMALAQSGMALMASKNPTLGGALGEAGLVGVGALQKAKSSYDKDILSLLGMQEDMRTADLNYAAKVAAASGTSNKELGQRIDDARSYLNSLETTARSYRRVAEGDPTLGSEDRLIDLSPPALKAEIIAAQDRLNALERLRSGGAKTDYDATK